MIDVTLFGATDLALRVADRLHEMSDVAITACIGAPPVITASFAPAGRPNVRHVDIGRWAEEHSVPHHLYTDRDGMRDFLSVGESDVAVVAGWHYLIPRDCLDRFRTGAIGFHASLLPKFRGAAPLNWAILSGASETGMSMFKLGDGVDDGPLVGQRTVRIGPRATIADLIQSTTDAAVDMLDLLPPYVGGELQPVEQEGRPSYSLHRSASDGRIDWAQPANLIDRLIRAVGAPYPGAFTELDGNDIVIWEAEPLTSHPDVWSLPGGILRLPEISEPLVVTGSGLLKLRRATDREGHDILGELLKSGHRRLG